MITTMAITEKIGKRRGKTFSRSIVKIIAVFGGDERG